MSAENVKATWALLVPDAVENRSGRKDSYVHVRHDDVVKVSFFFVGEK